MKSLKSLFALLAIASMTFACASVTDASLTEQDEPAIEITNTEGDDAFGTGNNSEPIIVKPKI